MKKFNFLIGALGGALGGFLMSNKKLRQQLSEAKSKKEAAKILGTSIQKSGTELAQDAKKLFESEEVQKGLSRFKKFAGAKWKDIRKEIGGLAEKATGRAKRALKKTTKQ